MHSTYILRSETNSDQYYVGLAEDVESRLKDHNAGKSIHTKKYIYLGKSYRFMVPLIEKQLQPLRYI